MRAPALAGGVAIGIFLAVAWEAALAQDHARPRTPPAHYLVLEVPTPPSEFELDDRYANDGWELRAITITAGKNGPSYRAYLFRP